MKKVALLTFLTLLCACVDNPENRGYAIEALPFDQIKVGETRQEEVLSLIGSPSVKSQYGDDTWYYIGLKMVRKASFMPLEKRGQNVLEIHFDEEGVVTAMNENHGEKNRDIQFTQDSTPTEGNEVGLVEQLLGNFGKFNKEN